MDDESQKVARHIMSRYEWRWLGISVGVLAIFLGVSIGFVMTHPGRLPMTPKIAPVAAILADPMFSHPGITRLGPHRYRAVVIAHQFAFDPALMTVPVDARVDFYITSADVVHGFELPGTVVNVEVFPGYVAHVHQVFHKTGVYLDVCDQYCGAAHQNMIGKFVVATPAAYRQSVATAANPAPAPGLPAAFSTTALAEGAAVYTANCAGCHQATGQGVAGAFPPLAGGLQGYTASAAGRLTITHILLFGLNGPIEAAGKPYNGVMPAWGAQLNDHQIAAVIDYIVTAWSNAKTLPKDFAPLTAASVATTRTPALSAHAVAAERAALPPHH